MEPFSDFYYNDSYETQVETGCRKRGSGEDAGQRRGKLAGEASMQAKGQRAEIYAFSGSLCNLYICYELCTVDRVAVFRIRLQAGTEIPGFREHGLRRTGQVQETV